MKKMENIKERRNLRMEKCLERGFIKLKISERRGVDGEDQGEEESDNGQVLGEGFCMFPINCRPLFSLMVPEVRLELCVVEYLDAYSECVDPVTKAEWIPFLQKYSGFMRYVTRQGHFLRYIIIILGYC